MEERKKEEQNKLEEREKKESILAHHHEIMSCFCLFLEGETSNQSIISSDKGLPESKLSNSHCVLCRFYCIV
jgi:hypothetical protein